MRKEIFANGEFYHIYNRGTDKRSIFSDTNDQRRFLQSMKEFNTLDPIGSIYEHCRINRFGSRTSKSGKKNERERDKQLVNIVAYCLNPNHYHFILEQVAKKGIEKYMQRLGTGYSKYFNNKHERSGSLFEGKFQAIHIDSNEYLLHVSVYVNLNDRVHGFGSRASKYHGEAVIKSRSSWDEYMGDTNKEKKEKLCTKDNVLGQFKNTKEYKVYAENVLVGIRERKILAQEKF
ncbi:MAG: transposase [bacterium]|nr:transposase [bacterium]